MTYAIRIVGIYEKTNVFLLPSNLVDEFDTDAENYRYESDSDSAQNQYDQLCQKYQEHDRTIDDDDLKDRRFEEL